MEPLATIEELAAQLPFEMDDGEVREAEGALASLSDDARFYGKEIWVHTGVTPGPVCRMVLRAANRHMKNYDGYSQSRAGDETVAWSNQDGAEAGSAHFTDREIAQLRRYAGKSKLHSAPVSAWGTNLRSGYRAEGMVPTEHGAPFPMFSSDTEPW